MNPHHRENGLNTAAGKDNHEKHILRSTIIAAAVAVMLGGSAFADPVHKRADSETPNIVLILTDDQSWVGTSLQIIPEDTRTRSDYFRTPNIERLGAMGMRFTQGYSPAASCCPTRRSIQTGQTPARHEYHKDRENWTTTYLRQLNIT